MKSNYFKAALLLAFLFLHYSGHSQNMGTNENKEEKSGNTSIIINFKKNADRYYTAFRQLNPLHLDPLLVAPPPHKIDTANKLQTIITLNLAKPSYLALGFSMFYIEPGDSLNINYETLLSTKTEFKDTITINHGNAFFITRNGFPSRSLMAFQHHIFTSIESIKSIQEMTAYLSEDHINDIIRDYIKLNYTEYPNLNISNPTLEKVNSIISDSFYRQLIYRLKSIYKNTKDKSLKAAIQESITKMLNNALMQKSDATDPITLGKYASIYAFYKEMNMNAPAIRAKFNASNDTVKQYILINLLNDGLLADSVNNEAFLFSKVTYPTFRDFAWKIYQKPNRGVEKSGYINNSIRNTILFNSNNQEILFGEIFKTTQRPFIILDFFGTWCKPCLDEMALYRKTKNLDNSKLIRPIWIFFENDKTKWMDEVKKNDLLPESCYVIIGEGSRSLMKEFALLFDWQGEFPHHFVLTSDGKMINKNAARLSAFSEDDLIPFVEKNGQQPTVPALPIGIK